MKQFPSWEDVKGEDKGRAFPGNSYKHSQVPEESPGGEAGVMSVVPGLETSGQEEEKGWDRLSRNHGSWSFSALKPAAQDPAEPWFVLSYCFLPTPHPLVPPLFLSSSLPSPQGLLQGLWASQEHPTEKHRAGTHRRGGELKAKTSPGALTGGPGPSKQGLLQGGWY